MNLWAVIPSKDRMDMLTDLVSQLIMDGVNPVIIDTGYNPPLTSPNTLRDAAQEPNISRWWNLGLDYVEHMEQGAEYVVAVLNDDLRIPYGFVQKMADAIANTGAAIAYPDQHDVLVDGKFGGVMMHQYAVPVDLRTRMCGYAFAMRGSVNLRADETMKWWYGDDDLDWRARQAGGSVLVGGVKVEHLMPNSTTVGELAEQAGRDRQTFINKWGTAPW